MKPTTFKQQSHVIAENQEPYLPLPALIESDGNVTTCWKLSFVERLAILFSGRVWIQTLTFKQPLQPLQASVQSPIRSFSPWGMLSLEDRAWAIALVPVSFLLLWLLSKGMAAIHIPIALRMIISLISFFVVPWGLVKATVYLRKRFK